MIYRNEPRETAIARKNLLARRVLEAMDSPTPRTAMELSYLCENMYRVTQQALQRQHEDFLEKLDKAYLLRDTDGNLIGFESRPVVPWEILPRQSCRQSGKISAEAITGLKLSSAGWRTSWAVGLLAAACGVAALIGQFSGGGM